MQETLPAETWCHDSWNTPEPRVPARCVRSGPDRSIASTHNMLLGAFSVAQKHIRIQSPYLLPDHILLGAINTPARRGNRVELVRHGAHNLRLVNSAQPAKKEPNIIK